MSIICELVSPVLVLGGWVIGGEQLNYQECLGMGDGRGGVGERGWEGKGRGGALELVANSQADELH